MGAVPTTPDALAFEGYSRWDLRELLVVDRVLSNDEVYAVCMAMAAGAVDVSGAAPPNLEPPCPEGYGGDGCVATVAVCVEAWGGLHL